MSTEPRYPHDHTHDHTHTHTYDPIGLITSETQHLTQAERSRLHFDNFAKLNADKFMEGRKFLSSKLQERLDWIGIDWTKPVRVLDYACGTGMVSHALAPYATPSSQFIGIDVSETMGADKYNATSSTLGFSPTFMKAYKGTLLEPTDPNPSEFSSPEFFNFDLVACSMSLHHFDDPLYAMKQFAKRARPDGGVVLIIDNREEHGGHSHEVFLQATGHKHNVAFGYKGEKMKQYYEEAGLGGEFEYVELEDGPHIDMGERSWDMRVFISKGKRAE